MTAEVTRADFADLADYSAMWAKSARDAPLARNTMLRVLGNMATLGEGPRNAAGQLVFTIDDTLIGLVRRAPLYFTQPSFTHLLTEMSKTAPDMPRPSSNRLVILSGVTPLLDADGDVISAYCTVPVTGSTGAEWVSFVGFCFDTTAGGPQDIGGMRIATYDLTASEDLRLLSLAEWLLDNPGLVEREEVDAAPHASKAARRRGRIPEPQPVLVVNLRGSARKRVDEVHEAERTYRHRWIVRGHWHTYLSGTGRTERTLKYTLPYVKGPKGAPLMTHTEVVRQWND